MEGRHYLSKPQRLHAYDSRWRVKAILRVGYCILAFLAIVGYAVTYRLWKKQYYTITFYPTMAFASIVVLVIGMGWQLFNGITLYVRVKPIPPGYNVAFDLIGSLVLLAVNMLANIARINASGTEEADLPWAFNVAALCFSWTANAVHIALFIIACVDTHKHRQRKRHINCCPSNVGSKDIEMSTASSPSIVLHYDPTPVVPKPVILEAGAAPTPPPEPVELESPVNTFQQSTSTVSAIGTRDSIAPPKAQDHEYAPYEYAGPSGAPPQYVKEHPAYVGQVPEEITLARTEILPAEKQLYNPRNLV